MTSDIRQRVVNHSRHDVAVFNTAVGQGTMVIPAGQTMEWGVNQQQVVTLIQQGYEAKVEKSPSSGESFLLLERVVVDEDA